MSNTIVQLQEANEGAITLPREEFAEFSSWKAAAEAAKRAQAAAPDGVTAIRGAVGVAAIEEISNASLAEGMKGMADSIKELASISAHSTTSIKEEGPGEGGLRRCGGDDGAGASGVYQANAVKSSADHFRSGARWVARAISRSHT
jgi:hypothetical protein